MEELNAEITLRITLTNAEIFLTLDGPMVIIVPADNFDSVIRLDWDQA